MKAQGQITFSGVKKFKDKKDQYTESKNEEQNTDTSSSQPSDNPKVQNYLKKIHSVDPSKKDPEEQILDNNNQQSDNEKNNEQAGKPESPDIVVVTDKEQSANLLGTTKNEKTEMEKIENIVDNSNEVLFSLKTSNPIDPFPDELVIDKIKVDLTFKNFIGSETHHSAMIKDITDVLVSTTPLFSTITIVDEAFSENTIKLEYLRTEEAIKARNIIQGLRIASNKDIDIAKIPNDKLVEKLEELGKNADI